MVLAAEQLWTSASDLLKSQVSDGVWQSTFAPAAPVELTSDRFVLGLPNGIIRDKLDRRYRPLVEDAVTEAAGHELTVDFQLMLPTLFDADLNPHQEPEIDLTSSQTRSAAAHQAPFEATLAPDLSGQIPGQGAVTDHSLLRSTGEAAGPMPGQQLGQGPIGPSSPSPGPASNDRGVDQAHRYTFDGFVIGPSNRFAHAAALSVAERPGGSYNPLFIYGSAGLGKTHILRAIQHFVNDVYPRLKVLYVSTETFLNEFVDSIRNSSGNDFKRRYRQIDVLLVDDIQFIEGKDSLQEELFHTFNDLYGSNRQIVLSSDRPPDAIPTLEERLKSRFMMGLLTDIQPPDIETRMAILRKKADRDGHFLPNEVSEFIATNITSNIRELEGALNKVTAFAHLNNQTMTRDVAEQVLGDFIADRQPRPITVAMILEATVEKFGFAVEELTGKSRRRPLVITRQMAMYVTRQLTDLSFPLIAREFGGRDHTTVMHACDKISALMKERSQIYNDVMALEKKVLNQAQAGDY
ncbi:MAG: chromosomal replication initiator protein DnaA [Actinomycetia bacterium]|nr:chromosomal replication initiator protein DnaA [Actinomycetes bacterium]